MKVEGETNILINNIKRIKKFVGNPKRLFYSLGYRGFFKWLPDKIYLKILFKFQTGASLNFKEPITFNEKLQWLKLNKKNKTYSLLVDKFEVRQYISKMIGSQYLIPLIGVYNDVDEIRLDDLPDKFVIKCTHDSGGVFICKDKKTFDLSKTKVEINKRLKRNYFWAGREYPYKEIQPRIIIEEFMEDKIDGQLRDYKFFCFNGEPKFMFIASNRGEGTTKFDFFDMEFKEIAVKQHYEKSKDKVKKPINFEEMIKLSKKLSNNMTHVRIDFYEINGKVYFGEFTFFHFSGLESFTPVNYDYHFGTYIDI